MCDIGGPRTMTCSSHKMETGRRPMGSLTLMNEKRRQPNGSSSLDSGNALPDNEDNVDSDTGPAANQQETLVHQLLKTHQILCVHGPLPARAGCRAECKLLIVGSKLSAREWLAQCSPSCTYVISEQTQLRLPGILPYNRFTTYILLEYWPPTALPFRDYQGSRSRLQKMTKSL